jgi:hypothetical protein
MCLWNDTVLVKVPVKRSPNYRFLPSHYSGLEWELRAIDSCLVDLVKWLNAHRCYTKACCCGHFKERGSILFWDCKEMKLPKHFQEYNTDQLDRMYDDQEGFYKDKTTPKEES